MTELEKVLELEERYFAALAAEDPEYVQVWAELDSAYAALKEAQAKS